MKRILAFSLFCLIWIGEACAQHVDTLYSSDSLIIKRVEYYANGKVQSIKHTKTQFGCVIPVLIDSVYYESGELVATEEHDVHFMKNSRSCDSLFKKSTITLYQDGDLQGINRYKEIGPFAKCPCGEWQSFNDGQVVFERTFVSCQSKNLSNLELTDIFWSPDSVYFVELYKETSSMAMPGQGGDHMATIILKTKSGDTVKVVSGKSSQSELHREIHRIKWQLDKNKLQFTLLRYIEWVNDENIDLEKTRLKINRFMNYENWDYFRTPEIFGDRCFIMGEFYDEPEGSRNMDMAVLIKDSAGVVKLLIINNYNFDDQEEFEFVEFKDKGDYAEIGHFKAVRKGNPVWSNWTEAMLEDGPRTFNEVPENEVYYLPYDAIYLHVAEACGGGFVYWKNNKWHWLQQE